MFIVQKDGVYLMKGVAGIKEYKELEKYLSKFYNEEALKVFMLYVCYMYNTDKKQNPYIRMPISDRKALIFDDYAEQVKAGFGSQKAMEKFISEENVSKVFIEYYNKYCLSDEDKIIQKLRNKIDFWLNEIDEAKDAKKEIEIYNAIKEATNMIEIYTTKKEAIEEDGGATGSLYLFEIPEGYKPHFLKLKGYTA